MDKSLLRNILIFLGIFSISICSLAYWLVKGEANFKRTNGAVEHTYSVVLEAEQVAALVEGMLGAQRGYLITRDKNFLKEYSIQKEKLSSNIYKLFNLTDDNPVQQARLRELQDSLNLYTSKLEERALKFESEGNLLDFRGGISVIQNLRDNIMRINQEILSTEHNLLKKRVSNLEKQRGRYLLSLVIGLAVSAVLIFFFNSFLLYAQNRRLRVEGALKTAEDRYKLALEGTQDGIFDWDIINNQVHYSPQTFGMLGYEAVETLAGVDRFNELLHPDDVAPVWDLVTKYLNHEIPEYMTEFRLKHASGRWVWIKSRAKCIFDKNGKAIRMVGAHTDITDMKKSQQRLVWEKEEAMNANRAKSEFLAHMSHEIRTPLTAISGIAEILSKQAIGFNERQQQLVKTLGSSTASLKELVNDILDFSKIESGQVEFDEVPFALDTVFEETVSMMALKANEKGISFVFDYTAVKGQEFLGDSKRIRQILVNLIGNAVKFTDQGRVTVKASFEERAQLDYLRIDISDTGIGIAPEDFDLVFEKFKQADSSISRKYGGTGLGLPISKKLAKLMGGDIFLSSQIMKGSTFSVLLPLKGSATKTASKDDFRENADEFLRSVINPDAKILVVEDYEGNIVVISYMLEEMGLRFDVARTGKQALDLWQSNRYDLILMDVQMPEMDGFTATKEIRRLEKSSQRRNVPIIGMTAHALVGDKNRCLEIGMNSYLSKPLIEKDFKSEVCRFLVNKESEAA